jgi:hypothetical protein
LQAFEQQDCDSSPLAPQYVFAGLQVGAVTHLPLVHAKPLQHLRVALHWKFTGMQAVHVETPLGAM